MSETVTNNSDSSVNSPGAILKRCREYHGISLEEAAEATKVGVNYLKALEEDQAKEFANLAYLKGFLRIYAGYLGLNPDDIMRLYEKMYAPAGTQGSNSAAGVEQRTAVRKRFSWQRLTLPLGLLLLLVITAAFINRSTTPLPKPVIPDSTAVPQAAPAVMPSLSSARQTPPEQKAEPVRTPAADNEQTVSTPPERSSAQQPADPPRGFVVRMKVTQNGTLVVTIDGAAAQNYDLVAGDVIEWKADKHITLDMSNAGGVETELNGTPLNAFGPVGKPAYVVLDAEGIKQ